MINPKDLLPPNFQCDPSMVYHLAKVFAGEYAYHCQEAVMAATVKSVLDIGGNAGAFTLWAAQAFPLATINVYEPSQESFALLTQNITSAGRATAYRCAVADKPGRAVLSAPKNNTGDRSITAGAVGAGEEVEVISARSLPVADLVKIDAEGAEALIISNLGFRPKYLCYEFHNVELRSMLEKYLDPHYLRWYHKESTPGLGIVGWIRKGPSLK